MVFGGVGVGSSGVFNLSSLTGANGFKLYGENNNDDSGLFVSTAGDINGDGYADVVVGAYGYFEGGFKGRSYVVFGGPGVGKTGDLLLSSLNGNNGFKLDGENNHDNGGWSVSAAGDINGDSVDDLVIGAYGYPSGNATGRSYVVFGDVPPVLVNNSLALSPGAKITVNATYLAAYDRNHNNNTLVFIPSSVSHGYFEAVTDPGVPLVNFTQQQVTNGTIQFVHDGSLVAPSYNITVRSTGIAWTGPSAAKITFIGAPQSHFPAIIPLANLNGQNGFKIDGEAVSDNSGNSVSAAGDFNGDGYADLLIGAYGHTNSIGRSYMVFGGPRIDQGGLFSLSNLNGTNGFKLDGEIAGELSGFSVSAAGDMNHDGYADFMIGTPLYSYTNNLNAGCSYIVFGGANIGSSGLLALSTISGANGFKFEGINDDQVGVGLSEVGDLNNDGYLDLIFGAFGHVEYNSTFTGRGYVLFGGSNLGANGLISASALNGLNGFILNAEPSEGASQTGRWVNAAGDVNGDSYADLIIGAPSYNASLGRSYVVFGNSRLGSNGALELSMLNGTNGFKITGEIVGDVSGVVNGPGDINGDGYDDLLIGACYFNNKTGRSYVLFGKSAIGSNGEILLSGLNGINGFKIDGEFPGDNSGSSSNSAGPVGDINADGYPDIPISSWGFRNSTGRSYIVFGGPKVGSNGLLSLSNLDGDTGFKMDGEIEGEMSGFFPVTGVGDINGDGVPDMGIGASNYNNAVGRTYIVFGDAPPTLVQNHLTLQPGNKVLLNSTFLSAYDRNHANNTILFVLTGITHGHFELTSKPGVALSNFTQPQLTNNTVLFIHDGSVFAPTYNVTVRSAGIAWTGPSAANVTFILPPPTTTPIISTTVSSSPSSSTLTPTMSPSTTITSTTQTVTPSSTTTTLSPSTTATPSPTTTFPITTILNPTSTLAPTTSTPSSSPTTPTPAVTFTPSPTSALPILINNQLTLSNGQTIILSTNNLQAVEAGMNANNLIFYVSNVQNGYFSLLPTNASVIRFLQSYVQKNQVQFVHSSNFQAPSYTTVVSDGSYATAPSLAVIDFLGAPTLTTTPITLTPGGKTTVTTSNLNVSNTGGSSSNQIVFQVSDAQHVQFNLNTSTTPVSNFTLTQVIDHNVQLVQDNSNIAPSYSITATGSNGLSSVPIPVNVQLCNSVTNPSSCAPKIVRNNLWIKQGASATLTSRNLLATNSSGHPLPDDTIYYVTNVNHGYFDVNGSSSSFFTQQDLQDGVVQFIDDGTNIAPSYQITVQSANLQTNSLSQVTLSLVNKPPYLSRTLSNQIAVVGQPFSLSLGSNVFADPQGDPVILSAGIYNSTQLLPSWLSFNPSTNRFSGTPTDPSVLDIGVTATDPEGLSTVGEFSLTIFSPSAAHNNSLTAAIASSVISGTIGLFFFGLKICLNRIANKKLEEALEETDGHEQKAIRPLGRAVAQRLKITGFMNHTTNREMLAFKDAIRTLLTTLADQGLNLEDPEMNETRRNYLINEIALQTKEYFLPSHQHCCRKSYQSLASFFKAEVTPQQIREAASAIAKTVIQNVNRPKSIEEKTVEMVPVETKDMEVTPHLEVAENNKEKETRLIDDELTSSKTNILVQKTGSPSIRIWGRESSGSASSNQVEKRDNLSFDVF